MRRRLRTQVGGRNGSKWSSFVVQGDQPARNTGNSRYDDSCTSFPQQEIERGQRYGGAVIANRWNDVEAARWPGPLRARVYTSRLLGIDPHLVLHGGGNTSVKVRHSTVFGEQFDALVVKGSGSDLADID